jgi:ABC-type Fe3+-hydroxamate transport system substrate-binding protein
MLDIAGGENVFAGQKRESVQVSAEVLLTAAPEVIVEIAVGGAAPDPRAWRAVPSLPAVRSGRIVVLSGTDLVTAGPRVASATERIARVLHPDAF